MAQHKVDQASLPTSAESVDSRFMRRPVKGIGETVKDTLTHRDTVMLLTVGAAMLILMMPASFILAGPSAVGYYIWASRQRYLLPFKAPINWGGTDYGAPKPGGQGKFGKAAGILYFGRDETSMEELWIENGDARRHGFFIGTTGSGKALPLDTPILTPRGWVFNGDLAPGDTVCHPDGGTVRVLSTHDQGAVDAVRVSFSDGREAVCSADHLWHVKARSKPGKTCPHELPEEGRVMEAKDIGILFGLYGGDLDVTVPRAAPFVGPESGERLSVDDARRAAEDGFLVLNYMPSVVGSPEERTLFLAEWVRYKSPAVIVEDHGLRLAGLSDPDARMIKQIAWSLGGVASTHVSGGTKLDVVMMFDGLEEVHPDAAACRFPDPEGLRITDVRPEDKKFEMACIKVDRDDGLYVMEGHVTTHNTELLLGVVSQTLMWSSGFLFIDGKGTTEFYARVWTLCKRFGREDDLRVLNFTDPGDDPDAPAGGPGTQSNTLNPFAKGSPDQLMNIVVSLMGEAGPGNDMWKSRAVSLVTALMMALCELRDSGEILLNVQTIRDFLALGKGIDKQKLRGKKPTKIAEVPDEAWEEMRDRAGLIELYLRAQKGDLSQTTLLALKGFFDTLPGFSLEKAMAGDPQETKCNEQYGFLSMQLTKPLGSLADGYGHIFRTPLGEIDIDDVVLNRRILVVLLPALQKAPEEMQNSGKIVVTLAKMMMGNAAGFELQGTRQEIVEAKQTRAPSPYIVVLDEAGYYMVKGIDVMMAQARSLGFMIIVAGQDMAAMQAIDSQIAETAAANASILAAGKTVDGSKTVEFIQKLIGKTTVSVSSGFQSQPGILGNKWVDRMDASFQEVDKVKLEELQSLSEGQFYFLFNGKLVRAATFFIGDDFGENFSVNKFLKVRGPTDRVPGLDQSVDISFVENLLSSTQTFDNGPARSTPSEQDAFAIALRTSSTVLEKAGRKKGRHAVKRQADLIGLAAVSLTPDPDGGSKTSGGWDDLVEESDETENGGAEAPDLSDLHAAAAKRRDAVPEIPGEAGTSRRVNEKEREGHASSSAYPPGAQGNSGKPRKNNFLAEAASRFEESSPDVPETVSESVSRATRGDTERDRHAGIIGMLEYEREARRKAEESGAVSDIEQSVRNAGSTETVAAMFGSMAAQMERMKKLLVTEVADGDLGAQIMERAAPMSPTKMPHEHGEDQVRNRMENLEEALNKSFHKTT